jgi:hypothetical protein
MGRTQHAPKLTTIAVALILVAVGALGTFLDVLPEVAGYSGETIGIAAYVLATALLLLGVFFRQI